MSKKPEHKSNAKETLIKYYGKMPSLQDMVKLIDKYKKLNILFAETKAENEILKVANLDLVKIRVYNLSTLKNMKERINDLEDVIDKYKNSNDSESTSNKESENGSEIISGISEVASTYGASWRK